MNNQQEFMLIEVKLGSCIFSVNFREKPDMALLSEPVDGPEHNFKVASLLKLLKRRRPEKVVGRKAGHLMDDSGEDAYDEELLASRHTEAARFINLPKQRQYKSAEEEEIESEDKTYCRRLWLDELWRIEIRLASNLREQLQKNAGEYLGHNISSSEIFSLED